MLDNYNFKDAQYDVKSLIHLFNLQGKELVGLELGVLRAESFCSILQNCPNIKTLYGVDSWKPYTDILGEPYSMSEQQQEHALPQAMRFAEWATQAVKGNISS